MNISRGIWVVSLGLLAATGAAAAGGGPMADAGLDQRVGVDTTVQLDATGSTHPDGEIESYEWRIETPDGRVIRPECADCPRTEFTPENTGRYEVTVTVTGSDGSQASDTLYVDVGNEQRNVEQNNKTTVSSDSNTQREFTNGPDENGSGTEYGGKSTIEIPPCSGGAQIDAGHSGGDNPCVDVCDSNSSLTGSGYATHSHLNECNVGDVDWSSNVTLKKQAEVTIEISDFDRGKDLLEGSFLTDFEQSPQYSDTRGSEGMGMNGEVNPIVEEARNQQQNNTGWLEGVLFGVDSAEVTQTEVDGRTARENIQRDSWESGYWHEGQTSGTVESSYNVVQRVDGAVPREMSDNESVQMTIMAGEGSGLIDRFGLEDAYSREDFEHDRSALSDGTSGFTDRVSEVVESTGNLFGEDGGDSSGESTQTATPTARSDDTMPSNDGSSEDLDGSSPDRTQGADYSDGSSEDDSGDRGVGFTSGDLESGSSSGTSAGSSDSSSNVPGNMDWQLPSDLGDTDSENSGGYATAPRF